MVLEILHVLERDLAVVRLLVGEGIERQFTVLMVSLIEWWGVSGVCLVGGGILVDEVVKWGSVVPIEV